MLKLESDGVRLLCAAQTHRRERHTEQSKQQSRMRNTAAAKHFQSARNTWTLTAQFPFNSSSVTLLAVSHPRSSAARQSSAYRAKAAF